jgi:hypothetical protein
MKTNESTSESEEDHEIMTDHTIPEALDPNQAGREIVVEATAETLEKMRKQGTVRGFTVMCDEGAHVGGDNTAPSPLAYFDIAIGF